MYVSVDVRHPYRPCLQLFCNRAIPTINVSEGSKRSLAASECNTTSSESDVARKGRESLRILEGMSACTDLTARTPHESRSKNLTSLAVFTSDVCVKRTHSGGASPALLWLEITRKASLLRELTPSGPPSRPGITWQSVDVHCRRILGTEGFQGLKRLTSGHGLSLRRRPAETQTPVCSAAGRRDVAVAAPSCSFSLHLHQRSSPGVSVNC